MLNLIVIVIDTVNMVVIEDAEATVLWVDPDLAVVAIFRSDCHDISTFACYLYVGPAVQLQFLPDLLAVHRSVANDKNIPLVELRKKDERGRSDQQSAAADFQKSIHGLGS
jgi:hypothetical protein